MQTRALGSRVAWQNQVPVLDDSQTLVSRDGQGGSEIRGGMGHKLALNARGGSQGTVQARAAVWVRVSLTIGNVDRMHRWSAWSALSGLTPRTVVV
jgi:hypothetical protein